MFHERTKSQIIHSCSKKYVSRQVSNYVGYAHVGNPEKKREFSFIPNISLQEVLIGVNLGALTRS